jgi:hypothetical protein
MFRQVEDHLARVIHYLGGNEALPSRRGLAMHGHTADDQGDAGPLHQAWPLLQHDLPNHRGRGGKQRQEQCERRAGQTGHRSGQLSERTRGRLAPTAPVPLDQVDEPGSEQHRILVQDRRRALTGW